MWADGPCQGGFETGFTETGQLCNFYLRVLYLFLFLFYCIEIFLINYFLVLYIYICTHITVKQRQNVLYFSIY